MSMFYNFILSMWIQYQLTAAQVRSFVPGYITQTECDAILATPQGGLNIVNPATV